MTLQEQQYTYLQYNNVIIEYYIRALINPMSPWIKLIAQQHYNIFMHHLVTHICLAKGS